MKLTTHTYDDNIHPVVTGNRLDGGQSQVLLGRSHTLYVTADEARQLASEFSRVAAEIDAQTIKAAS